MRLYRGGLLDSQHPAPRVRPLHSVPQRLDERHEPRRWHTRAPWPRWSVPVLLTISHLVAVALGWVLATGGGR